MVKLLTKIKDGQYGGAVLCGRSLAHDVNVLYGYFFFFVICRYASDNGHDGALDVGVAILLGAVDDVLHVVVYVFVGQFFVSDFGGEAISECDWLATKGDFFLYHSSWGLMPTSNVGAINEINKTPANCLQR